MFQTSNIIRITTKPSECKQTDCLRPSLLSQGKGYIILNFGFRTNRFSNNLLDRIVFENRGLTVFETLLDKPS